MMKKLLMTVIGSGALALGAMAQCTPNPNYHPTGETGAGIEDLPCAVVNQQYSASSTIVIPPTITITNPLPITVRICRVTISGINNFPANTGVNYPIYYKGVSYGLGQEIILDPAVDRACVSVLGTFTTTFSDSLFAQGQVRVSLDASNCNSLQTFPFTAIPGASHGIPIGFNVRNTQAECDALLGIEETISNNSFDVAQNFPNPFNGDSQIAYNLPEAGKVTFRVTNLVGKTVKEVNASGNTGLNYISISSTDYAAGVYMYSISFKGKTVTKRMIIK